jgi:hypothetical protein
MTVDTSASCASETSLVRDTKAIWNSIQSQPPKADKPNMSHIVGHSRRKDLQDLRYLPRSPVLSYMQKQAVPRAPRVKTASRTPARHPILAAFTPKGRNWIWEYLLHRIGPRHRFQVYANGNPDQGVYKLKGDHGEIRIALAGDWATATDEAESVSKLMILLSHIIRSIWAMCIT